MARILVTGGAGYVGSVLVPKLARRHDVTVLDACIFGLPSWSDRSIRTIIGDIRDPGAVAAAVTGAETVIHLACLANDPASELDERVTREINYDATLGLLAGARAAGARRFIYASSSSVYGVKEEDRVVESLPLAPITLYARLKAEAERAIRDAAAPDFVTTSVRSATVCGLSPRMRFDVIVNLMCRLAESSGRIVVHGGAQQRPNVHIEDITDAYVALVSAPAEAINGREFNVGTENHSVLAIARLVQEVCGGEVAVDDSHEDDRSYRIDSEAIANALGVRPRRSVADAIRDISAAFATGRFADHENDRYFNVRATGRWLATPVAAGRTREPRMLASREV